MASHEVLTSYDGGGPKEKNASLSSVVSQPGLTNIEQEIRTLISDLASHEIVEGNKRAQVCKCMNCEKDAKSIRAWWNPPSETIHEAAKYDIG